MAKPIITLIGLGTTGASMGLGLQRAEGNFELVGHDKRPEIAQQARKLGAVQRVEWNLFRACEGAELIVMAVPLAEIEELLKLLSDELKPGTLILALTNLLQPAIDLAARYVPAGAHFVVGHPVVAGVGVPPTPRADRFEKCVFALAAGLKTEPSAVQLAADFVERVGATPLFVDAQEHDGIIAGVEQLPQVLALALMRAGAASGGWREARRLAGTSFAAATDVGDNGPALVAALRANKQNVLLKLRELRQELADWQALLEAEPLPDQPDALAQAVNATVEARLTWEGQTILKNWEEAPTTPSATAEGSGFLRQMFLGNFMGKRTDKRTEKR